VMLTFADIFEAHADTFGSATAIACGEREISWLQYDDLAARLASVYASHGLGVDSKVGMFMYNCPEYLITQYAAFKSRVTPVNVNYRYLDDELLYLLDNADCEAVVFHSSLGDRISRVADRLPKLRLLIEVSDGPTASVPGSMAWNEVLVRHEPAPRQTRELDDLYMLYTGGTTGMPKGVMYHTGTFTQGFLDFYTAPMGKPPFATVAEVTETAQVIHSMMGQPVSMPCCPLMHGTGVWLGALVPHLMAGKVVLLEGRSFDAHEMFEVVEKHKVSGLVIVGDAFARPMMMALRERSDVGRPFDTSSVTTIISTGAMFSTDVKEAIFEHMPSAIVMDILGASEGAMAQMIATKDAVSQTAKFGTMPNTKVFDLETETEVEAGSGVIGVVAVSGANVPLGYYKDPEKSSRTFREIGGVRYSFPGDMAMVEADGSITLLGRGSNCINTAGEKVFPEEVEEAVKTHPAIADCLVFGVADERFGQRVVGVASLSSSERARSDDVIAHTKTRLSSYKVPKQLVIVDEVPRAPNGKADYVGARALFDAAMSRESSS
jgi:acyl-CoA synthetase (AMP-forming)/AMP-acid ligase II